MSVPGLGLGSLNIMHATLDMWRSSFRSIPGEMDETDSLKFKRFNEDNVSLAPSTTESIIVEGRCVVSLMTVILSILFVLTQ